MHTETSSSDCPCGPEGDIKGQRQRRFTREVAASAYASHRQGRLYSRKTLALSLAHEGGPLTVMPVAPGWRFSPKPWNQSAPASSQAFHMPGMLCGPQVASKLQISRWWWHAGVAGGQRGQPIGWQPRDNGYSCSHEASGISVDNPEV